MELLQLKILCKTSCFLLKNAIFLQCYWKNIEFNIFGVVLQNAKQRANEASKRYHKIIVFSWWGRVEAPDGACLVERARLAAIVCIGVEYQGWLSARHKVPMTGGRSCLTARDLSLVKLPTSCQAMTLPIICKAVLPFTQIWMKNWKIQSLSKTFLPLALLRQP